MNVTIDFKTASLEERGAGQLCTLRGNFGKCNLSRREHVVGKWREAAVVTDAQLRARNESGRIFDKLGHLLGCLDASAVDVGGADEDELSSLEVVTNGREALVWLQLALHLKVKPLAAQGAQQWGDQECVVNVGRVDAVSIGTGADVDAQAAPFILCEGCKDALVDGQ